MSIVTTSYATVNADGHAFYAASQFSGTDVRIYEIDGDSERWVLKLTGPDAQVKAEVIAGILNTEAKA
jgi:hypothetical protein